MGIASLGGRRGLRFIAQCAHRSPGGVCTVERAERTRFRNSPRRPTRIAAPRSETARQPGQGRLSGQRTQGVAVLAERANFLLRLNDTSPPRRPLSAASSSAQRIAMNIRIECVAGDPPTWKVFLGTFFWSCITQEEAQAWAAAAQHYLQVQGAGKYRLPAPFPAAAERSPARRERSPRLDHSR